jgi:ParB family chromosome partitioning protein
MRSPRRPSIAAADAHCLEIRPTATPRGHADGIEDTAAAKALADRHAGWAADMPRDVADLWGFIAGLDHASVMALLAHCASQTVNAVKAALGAQAARA